MKKILIVAPYCSLPNEPYFNRFLFLARKLSGQYDVTLLTSDFRHFDKTHRSLVENSDFKVCLIHEPGYKNNVSIKRVFSHKVFINNFKDWIVNNFEYDLVYSAYPLIQTNIILSELKSTQDFKLVVDVQDVWPESISSALPFLYKFPHGWLPFSGRADKAYASADALIAVSQTYMRRAKEVNKHALSEVVYIGSDFKAIEKSVAYEKDKLKFTLGYIGTLSHSYDVETIIKAINKLVRDGLKVEFHIFGGGPFELKLKKIAGENVIFHGFVDVGEVFSFLKSSDVAVNCLASSAKQSVTNKLSDYMSVGIPVLNSQKNIEVLELLNEVEHVNYEAGNVNDAVEKILYLYNKKSGLFFKPNARFNRDIEYIKITNLLGQLLK